jgi:hypothetical protein
LKNIELLSTQLDVALINLLTEPNLKEITRGLFDSLIKKNDDSLPSKMEKYEIATSKSMLQLIRDMKNRIDGEGIKTALTEKLMAVKAKPVIDKFNIPLIIYTEVYNTIGAMLNGVRTNTSIVFESAKNAERSEFIEDLRLKSYSQIIDNFTDLTIHNKNSASPTIVFSGILKTDSARRLNAVREITILNVPRLFFKVERADISTGYAIIEQVIYRELFKLVKYNMTPHILCKVATNVLLPKFYDTMKIVSDDFKTKLEQEMTKTNSFLIKKKFVQTDIPWDITRLLVTQKGEIELYKIIEKELELDRLKRVLFQLFYTLYVFENIECNHGDLHLANIFVNKLPKVTTYCYKVNDILYKINTDESVKIFDFDCSKIFKKTDVMVNTQRGMIIQEVYNDRPQPGITNVYNKNIDKVKLLLNLIDNATLKPLIERIIPGLSLEETVRNTYLRLLFSGDNQERNRKEASRIFSVEISEPSDIDKCEIGESILNRSWNRYFGLISKVHVQNWIIKSGVLDDYSKDHLWIPDEIVLPYEQILALLANPIQEAINVRNGPVYTIDGRL